ncbi:Uncharacterised protein [Serratia plymuthica]|uniref:Uncharacterized protein n=1 Tax=Serratia plymuthica TaxID=82996 RepID=A0A2X4VED5_SERPL|nr:Uncharacterised protein [Serratia plymuthica]
MDGGRPCRNHWRGYSFCWFCRRKPCSVDIAGSTANTKCYRNGQHYQGQQTLSHFDVSRKELPLNLGTTEMQWVDQQKKLAVMTVVYR